MPVRPVHDRAVARAAPVRGDLLGPLIRGVHRVRPADRVVVVGVRSAELVDLALHELDRLDRGHAVQHRHLVEAAVQRSFGRGAVVADDVEDQRVIEYLQILQRIDQPSDVVVGVLEKRRIDLHLPGQDRLQLLRHLVPGRNFLGPLGELGIARDDPELLLPGEDLLAQLVPALIELALVLVDPFLRHVVRGVAWRPARST